MSTNGTIGKILHDPLIRWRHRRRRTAMYHVTGELLSEIDSENLRKPAKIPFPSKFAL